jgi:hypothetical protein
MIAAIGAALVLIVCAFSAYRGNRPGVHGMHLLAVSAVLLVMFLVRVAAFGSSAPCGFDLTITDLQTAAKVER